MAIKWLWFSFFVDPLVIIIMGSLGIWLSTRIKSKSESTYKRISEYALKAVALTAAVVGIASFPMVMAAGPQDSPKRMILLAFVTIVIGAVIGSWTNFDQKLEDGINKKWSKSKGSGSKNKLVTFISSLEDKRQDKTKSFGWAAAYATYVSLVGVLSIMGPIHEASVNADFTYIIMKCVLDAVATFVFAVSWGPGVLVSAIFVFVWQVIWGLAAPFLTVLPLINHAPILTETVIDFADGVGGMIIMAMGLSVAGILKDSEGKSFRTGNLFPAMILSFIVGIIAVAFSFYW